jgi:hypothetical protein
MKTPTPRTDAAVKPTFGKGHNTVCPNFARGLERELAALTTERDHLHAQLRALTLICGTNDANKFETWVDRANARAERAETELATERARLDAGTILLAVAGERVWHCGVDLRAAIDAGIKEGTK